VITTPGVPPERVKFLRKTLLKCVNDKEFLKKAKRLQLSPNTLAGEQVEEMVMKLMKMPSGELKQIKYVVYEKYQ
jgi:tripartite-type tricarboxylate transporter receptor subunit TctC